MSSPWADISKPNPVKLSDIISEEIIKKNQVKEEEPFQTNVDQDTKTLTVPAIVEDILDEVISGVSNEGLEKDVIMAKMLQIQFNKEYAEELKTRKLKLNPALNDNYSQVLLDFDRENIDEKEINIKDLNQFNILETELPEIHYCGYKKPNNKKLVTEHDIIMSEKKHCNKDDGDDFFKLEVSNEANRLIMYPKQEQARKGIAKKNTEKKSTAILTVDKYDHILLWKMYYERLLQKVNHVINVGKEAVILHANRFPSCPDKSGEQIGCVIKIFRTTTPGFQGRHKYIKDDCRFKDRIIVLNTRGYIQMWAEKEKDNLIRLRNAGVLCPQVIGRKQNILVMSFIGEKCTPAPNLNEAEIQSEDLFNVYQEVIEAMKVMYEKADLIHADLSELNILWYKKRCYFIDVSQAVEPTCNNAFKFLYKDCCRITKFFAKQNLCDILSAEELFQYITGVHPGDRITLTALGDSIRRQLYPTNMPPIETTYNLDCPGKT